MFNHRCFATRALIVVAAVFSQATEQCIADEPSFSFEMREIDPQIGDVCYAVTSADVDADGLQDIVAISESAVFWYRNPDWKKTTIIDDKLPRDHVCIAPFDINRNGKIDFAIGAGWPQNGGAIFWIEQGASPEADWKTHQIGAEPSTHRMRFADVLGRGEAQLVVSPLNATVGGGARILAYCIPLKPTIDDWLPVVVDGSLNRIHNHLNLPIGDSQQQVTLAASQEGITMIAPEESGGFELTEIASGSAGNEPAARGTGEIKAGRLSSTQTILASIEPMHGNQVVVYLMQDSVTGSVRERIVLDESLNQGHALAVADLDGDGIDEVIAGFRQPREQTPAGPGIIIYRATDDTGAKWTATPLDLDHMACEDLIVHDFNGDGRPDIVAGGRATKNVRLYLNGRRR
jgi:hypothetical protein